nr:zonular occludens toxin domain-containing protein [uncultured Desulfobulbus sp.]
MAVIEMFCGAMGNGKSAIVNARAFRFLRRGGVIGLNYPLVDDWAIKYATRILSPLASDQLILDTAVDYYNRAFRFGSVQSCYDFAEKVSELATGKQAKTREEWGLQVFDEASLYFNSRDYQKLRNNQFIEYFINIRKLKVQAVFMTHNDEDIDKQIRGKVDLVTWCRNMQKRKFLGISLSHFYKHPRFATQSIVNGAGTFKGMMEDKFTYRLDYDTCDLYDTFKLFKDDALEEEYGLEHLGLHPQEYYKTAESIKRELYSSITFNAKMTNYYEIIQPFPCY